MDNWAGTTPLPPPIFGGMRGKASFSSTLLILGQWLWLLQANSWTLNIYYYYWTIYYSTPNIYVRVIIEWVLLQYNGVLSSPFFTYFSAIRGKELGKPLYFLFQFYVCSTSQPVATARKLMHQCLKKCKTDRETRYPISMVYNGPTFEIKRQWMSCFTTLRCCCIVQCTHTL